MIDKIKNIFENDGLLIHKIGLVVGTIIGVLIGGIISDQADQVVIEEILEVTDETSSEED